MSWAFVIIGAWTIASAVAAMSLRHLVHCALCLAAAFAGLAALYLRLGAQFVGFAQILVYIGAVAILIVFAILLTRSHDPNPQPIFSSSWWAGLGVAVMVFGLLAYTCLASSVGRRAAPPPPEVTVQNIGAPLMTEYVLPLEVIGLLLTAALIGAVIIAMKDEKK
jgi:NADH-quinone oxidoreductase subunit J